MNDSLPEFSEARRKTLEKKASFFKSALNPISKVRQAADGEINTEALNIVRIIYVHKHPKLRALAASLSVGEQGDFGPTSNPLCEKSKERILQAVLDFDVPFLQSLIAAMDLCEKSTGLDKRLPAEVMLCHESFTRDNQRLPTNRELLDLLFELGMVAEMDRKTLDFVCKAHGLALAKGTPGRPKNKKGS